VSDRVRTGCQREQPEVYDLGWSRVATLNLRRKCQGGWLVKKTGALNAVVQSVRWTTGRGGFSFLIGNVDLKSTSTPAAVGLVVDGKIRPVVGKEP
jgi:hypothetical protein